MTQQELKDKALKIAARMRSSNPNEAAVAAAMLRKLLDEHHLTMRDIGLQSHEVSLYAGQKHQQESVNTCFSVSDIKEIFWKKSNIQAWEDSMVVNICQTFGAWTIHDVTAGFVKIVGFQADLTVITIILSSLDKFVWAKLAGRTFRNSNERNSFAAGIYSQALKNVARDPRVQKIEEAKRTVLYHYVVLNYGFCPYKKGEEFNQRAYSEGTFHGQGFAMKSSRPTNTPVSSCTKLGAR